MTGSIGIADLWILPPPTHSAWFSRLDWYLNWQMCKGLARKSTPPPAEVFRLAEEHGIKIEIREPSSNAPLVISSHGLVPAKACVVVPIAGDGKGWLEEAKGCALNWRASRVEVFLPKGVSREKAQKAWEKIDGVCAADFREDA